MCTSDLFDRYHSSSNSSSAVTRSPSPLVLRNSFSNNNSSNADLVRAVLAQYEAVPYGTANISEEEFVFDSLRNPMLYDILQSSCTLGNLTEAAGAVAMSVSGS